MISRAQILRMAEHKQYARLLQRVLDNGRPCDATIRQRLCSEAVACPASLALAVQRYLELSYDSRSVEGDRLISWLVMLQDHNGLFGSDDATDDDRIAATALAIRALMDYLTTNAGHENNNADESDPPTMRLSAAMALERAAQAMIARRAMEYCMGGDLVTAQIVEWQLGDGLGESNQTLDVALDRVIERVHADIQKMDSPKSPGGFAEAA